MRIKKIIQSFKVIKVWSRNKTPRPKKAAGNYQLAYGTVSETSDDAMIENGNSKEIQKLVMPPRYRFRDLLLGDFAFNDDGER